MLTIEQQIFEQIKKAHNILITFSKAWHGDSVASALALVLFLKKLNKNVEIAAEKFDPNASDASTPVSFSFLPSFREIKNSVDNLRQFIISLDITNTKVDQIKYKVEENSLNFMISPKDGFFTPEDITSKSGGFKYDLIIVVDAPDLESLGKIYDNDTEFFYETTIINIDHHGGNEDFGQINFTELNAVSTTEILFSLFDSYSRDFIDEDIATCLLTGMISKTRSFKTPNVTPKALSAAAQLISMGARREEIVNSLYRSRPLNVIKLWGRVLARLSSSLDEKLIWSTLADSDFEKTATTESDLNEVIDELIINMPLVKVIVIIYEKVKDGKVTTNAFVHAMRSINALDLVKELSPQGVKSVVKIEINKPLLEAEKEIIKIIEEKMKKLAI